LLGKFFGLWKEKVQVQGEVCFRWLEPEELVAQLAHTPSEGIPDV